MYKLKCKTCSKNYVPIQETQKFCNKICRDEWWQRNPTTRTRIIKCVTCGKEFTKYNDNHKFCGYKCRPTAFVPKKKPNNETGKRSFIETLKKIYKSYNLKFHRHEPVPIKMVHQYAINERFNEIDNISPSKKGAITEHEFMCHVSKRGWECFRNFAPTGPIDLVIFKEKESYFIDIKTNPHSYLKDTQMDLGVKMGYLDKERNVAVLSESYGHIIKQI